MSKKPFAGKIKIGLLFVTLILAMAAMIPLHEAGHALFAWLCGGKVISVCLIPGASYAGYTVLSFADTEMTFWKDFLVSSGGYLITMIAAAVCLLFCKRRHFLPGFHLYLVGLLYSFVAAGQYVSVAFATATFLKTGNNAETDIVSTLSHYMDQHTIYFVLLSLSICISIGVWVFALSNVKKQFAALQRMLIHGTVAES